MTDNKLRNIIRDEFGKIYADENVKAQILKGLTGDTMKTEKRESIITTANAENNEKTIAKETNTNGKARVAPRGRIAAAAAAVVLCVGGGAYLLKSGDMPDIENPSASSVADTDSGTDNLKSVEFDGFFDENGYTVYDKFGDLAQIWILPNGKFLVQQSANEAVYDYIIYNGKTNSIENVMQTSGGSNVWVYDNGFSVKAEMSAAEMGAETTHLEFYNFNCELVNSFDFDISSAAEDGVSQTIERTAVSHDGQKLFVLANVMENDIFISNRIYEVASEGETAVICDTAEQSQENETIRISDIYPSNDGNAVYFEGFSYYPDNEVWDLILGSANTKSADRNQAEGGFNCKYNSSSASMMRNGKLYNFSETEPSCSILSRNTDNGESYISIKDCQYDFAQDDNRFSGVANGFYVSYSGKYIIMTESIYNEEGIYTDTYIAVYATDGFKEIYSDAVECSMRVTVNDGVLFDEKTGDLCLTVCNLGENYEDNGYYCVNVFGGEYTNFGIKQTVNDDSSVPQDGQTVTTTVTAVENSEVDETEDFKAVQDNYNPDIDAVVSYITDEEQKEQILDWYDNFVNAGYEPVELNHINDWSNENPVTLYFTARNGDKVSMNIPIYDGANIEINDEYYSLPDVSILGLFDNYIGEFKITCTDYNYNYVGYVNYYGAKEDYLEWYNDFVNAGYEPVDISNVHAAGGGIYPKLSFKVNNSEVVICDSQYPDNANICVNGKYYLIPEEKLNVLDFSDKIRNYYSDLY